LLALACVFAGVTVDRKLLLPLFLIVLWNVGGLISLMPVVYDETAVTFVVISIYMGLTSMVFACLFAQDPMRRLEITRTAYIISAVIASIIGIIGYFDLLPGAWDNFTRYNRLKSTFKDPNLFGPFAILPLLFLISGALLNGLRLRHIVCGAIILVAVLLSFSRAAWAHFIFSSVLMVALMFIATPSARFRARIATATAIATTGVAVLVIGILSVGHIGAVFKERASLIQDYDAGDSGRFTAQAESIPLLLDRPNGFGPYQFHNHYDQDPHDVYLNAFASYGWLGGISYAALVLATLCAGYMNVLKRTPWQQYLIMALATYTGVAFEGFVIDTDHWRSYYLVMGMVWGLVVATLNYERRNYLRAAI
ncbi:MAG: O-antigen ligase family protein, partial [Pseudorhodoplanes sp.]